MKRGIISFLAIIIGVMVIGLSQTAIDPEDFSGTWYAASDQSTFLFQNGLIYCRKHSVELPDEAFISGAYTYSKHSVFLFAAGIEGLETEKELYLIRNRDGSFLCEKKDGTGEIYFIRNDQ